MLEMAMAWDLQETYLLLEPDGEVVALPVSESFWADLMSGAPTDPRVRRLARSDGRLVSASALDADWTQWERHPAGDEVLVVLEGQMVLLLEEPGGVREVDLPAGRAFVVPAGRWHTARVVSPGVLLALTQGQGTEHRAVQEPAGES